MGDDAAEDDGAAAATVLELYKGVASFLHLDGDSQSLPPLQAMMMLDRFSLLLDRPSCIKVGR